MNADIDNELPVVLKLFDMRPHVRGDRLRNSRPLVGVVRRHVLNLSFHYIRQDLMHIVGFERGLWL